MEEVTLSKRIVQHIRELDQRIESLQSQKEKELAKELSDWERIAKIEDELRLLHITVSVVIRSALQ